MVRVSSSLCLQNAHQGWIQTSATSFQKLVRIVKKLKKKPESHARKSQPLDANSSQGPVVQSPIKLTQGKREFSFQFCNVLVRCSVYVVCPSVLSCGNLKLHQILQVKHIFKQENVMLQLTCNPGLTLTGFRTTRPRCSITEFVNSNPSALHLLPACSGPAP